MGKPLGWWVEDALIDRLDKSLSMLFFTMDLGAVAETLLSIPGTWFGLPTPAWGIVPCVVTFYSELCHLPGTAEYFPFEGARPALIKLGLGSAQAASFAGLALVPAVLWTVVHVRYLVKGQFVKTYLATKYLMVPATQIPIALAHYSGISYATGAWFVCAWTVAQTLGFVLKVSSARRRPRVSPSIATQLAKVPRAFPEIQHMLMVGESVLESFPSGDTIGSAVFSAHLIALGAPKWAAAVATTTAFCRMYFHAHHLLDVSVGLAIGFATVAYLPLVLPVHSVSGWTEAIALTSFIGFHVVCNRFKPELPAEYHVKGRKGF